MANPGRKAHRLKIIPAASWRILTCGRGLAPTQVFCALSRWTSLQRADAAPLVRAHHHQPREKQLPAHHHQPRLRRLEPHPNLTSSDSPCSSAETTLAPEPFRIRPPADWGNRTHRHRASRTASELGNEQERSLLLAGCTPIHALMAGPDYACEGPCPRQLHGLLPAGRHRESSCSPRPTCGTVSTQPNRSS